MSVTLPGMHMPRVTYLRRPAHSGWLQGVVTGISLQQGGRAVRRAGLAVKPLATTILPSHESVRYIR